MKSRITVEYIDKMKDMLEDESYDFAKGTVQGILNNVLQYNNITNRQIEAIDNIRNAVEN